MLMAELKMSLAMTEATNDAQFKDALQHYSNLLEKQPGDWRALSKVLYLYRRAGRLVDFNRLLKRAERATAESRIAELDPGYRYIRGLFYRAMNKPSDALVDLNFARTRDSTFRTECTLAMIDIYLFPDPNNVSVDSLTDSGSAQSGAEDHFKEVESLIAELHHQTMQFADFGGGAGGGGSGFGSAAGSSSSSSSAAAPGEGQKVDILRLRVYQCQNYILTKRKAEIEKGVQWCLEILNESKNYIPAMLALAQALIIRKESTKARNQLKRIAEISKKQYAPQYADDHEKGWLLLADIYISTSKYDLATTLCQVARDHNKSSGKAWENLGLIHEKEQAYKDAAQSYERAWETTNKTSPQIGYRLAFNYLKAKRYVESVMVCQQVLRINENYPKIRKEILEKARVQLRDNKS